MKKTVSFIVSIAILSTCLLCGCEKTDNSKGKKDKNTDEETEEVETEEKEETKETPDAENSKDTEGAVPSGSESEEATQETSATMGPSGHIFENGVCADCGIYWQEYVYDAFGEMTGDTDEGYHSFELEDCDLFLSSGDVVKYNLANKDSLFINYIHTQDEESMITLSINDNREQLYENKTYFVLRICYDFSRFSDEEDVVPKYRFCYRMEIFIDRGECDKIFSSKEQFEKVCRSETDKVLYIEPSLIIYSEDNYPTGIRAWDEMTEEEIKDLFDEYGVTYLSKDEFIDLMWEDHDNYFGSIDYGLAQIDTSLADDGINWNQK